MRSKLLTLLAVLALSINSFGASSMTPSVVDLPVVVEQVSNLTVEVSKKVDTNDLSSTTLGSEGIRQVGALGGYDLEEFFRDTYPKGASRDKPTFIHEVAPTPSLVVSWSGGDVYSPADGYFHLSSGVNSNLIDNAINYAYWDVAYSNDVKWTTTRPQNGYIVLARFITAFGAIIQSDYTHAGSDHIIETESAFSDIFPSVIVSDNGLLVSPTGTALSNIIQSAGTEYQNMNTKREHNTQNLSDNTITYGLVAYGHTNSGSWGYTITNILPIGLYDTGSNVVACDSTKWYRGAFISFAGNPYMTWIYPQGSYTNEDSAILGNDPVVPSPFEKYIPLITAYVFKGDDTTLRTETKNWLDRRRRPAIAPSASTGSSGSALTPTLDQVMIAGSSLGGILPHDAGDPTDPDQLVNKHYVDYLDDIVKNSFRISKDPSGWDGDTDNRSYIFDSSSNRTFTITNATPMIAYDDGILLTNATSLTWPKIGTNEGIWYIYFSHDTKQMIATNAIWNLYDIQVATIYWGGGESNATYIIGEETHGFMPWTVHERFHLVDGSGYANGMSMTLDGYSFTNTAGMWADEDIFHAVYPTSETYIMYRLTNTNIPVFTSVQNQYVITNANGLMFDNNGVLTEVPDNSYISMWCYVNSAQGVDYLWVVGRAASNLLTIAAESPYNLSTTFPTAEGLLLYKVILQQTNNTSVVERVVDFRKSRITGHDSVFVDHNTMFKRDMRDSHPLEAISGYETLATKEWSSGDTNTVNALTLGGYTIEDVMKVGTKYYFTTNLITYNAVTGRTASITIPTEEQNITYTGQITNNQYLATYLMKKDEMPILLQSGVYSFDFVGYHDGTNTVTLRGDLYIINSTNGDVVQEFESMPVAIPLSKAPFTLLVPVTNDVVRDGYAYVLKTKIVDNGGYTGNLYSFLGKGYYSGFTIPIVAGVYVSMSDFMNETNRSIGVDNSLQSKIDINSNIVFSINTNLIDRINTETNRAIVAEGTLDSKINTASNTLYSVDTNIQAQVTSATNRILNIEANTQAWNNVATSAKFYANIGTTFNYSLPQPLTKVLYTNLISNIGGTYSNTAARWIPGISNVYIRINGSIRITGAANDNTILIQIYKNGTLKATMVNKTLRAGTFGETYTFIDITTNAADYYEVWSTLSNARSTTGSGMDNWWSGQVVN